MDFDTVFSGSDDDLLLLAAGFPKVKKFVCSGPYVDEGIGRTLACLYHLSRECPDLREIEIELSSDIFDNLNAIKKLPQPIVRNYQHPLEKLYIDFRFGQLRPEPVESVQVAQLLDLIFPNLITLETNTSVKTETELRLALQNARINR
jgi:hypothetical protein